MRDDCEIFDAVIVGGGIAGLYAASLLAKSGCRIALVEARDRLGGRILTVDASLKNEPIELGAEFVHGLPLEIQKLVSIEDELSKRKGKYFVARYDGPKGADAYFEKLRSILDQLPSSRDSDLSFSDFLSRHSSTSASETLAMAKNYIEGYHAADTSQISAQVLGVIERESEEVGAIQGAYLFRHGWQTLVDRLGDSIQDMIHLNSAVKRIVRNDLTVAVECAQENSASLTLRTRSVLVTVPIGVLKASPEQKGAIEFSPELPHQKIKALKTLQMSQAVRIVYQFKTPFWGQIKALSEWGMLFDLAPESKLRTWWPRGNLLIGWIGGPDAKLWNDLSEQSRRIYGLTAIARILGVSESEVESQFEASYFHDWSTDPYARGVYNYVSVGGLSSQKDLAQPVDSTIFFAGEATQSGGYSGTANGAIISGARAAKQILGVLGKANSVNG